MHASRPASPLRRLRGHLGAVIVLVAATVALALSAGPARALDPVNPVIADVNGHPANSGFLVFVEGDVVLNNDEAEGTIALGGDLTIARNYQVAAGSIPPTFTAPGDARPTYLYVGGGVSWIGSSQVYVENQGFTKIADTSTYTAYNRDNNNALVNYRIVPAGQSYNTGTFIDGRTNQQTPASIAAPVPTNLIDIPTAFTRYRQLATDMGACPTTVRLTDSGGTPLSSPIPPGTAGRLTLTAGATNVLTLTTSDLDNLSEITFVNQPTISTPLLVNVTGTSFAGDTPNMAGISGSQAPYILWNFRQATSIIVTGGASIEGTLFAPDANLIWAPTQNIEGNVIAGQFSHGRTPNVGAPREIHGFPFSTTLTCVPDVVPEPSAQLTLVKTVVNDDGGTAAAADWTLAAAGPTAVSGTTGDPAVTDATVLPGDYDLTEGGGPSGYRASAWVCDGGAAVIGSTVTLADGDDVTCTVTNDDISTPVTPAALTLVKKVVNDDGGTAVSTDWQLTATGTAATITGTTGDSAVTAASVPPGVYDLTETSDLDGYDAHGWICDNAAVAGSKVSLGPGDDVTCTITNDDERGAFAPDETGNGPGGGSRDDSGNEAGNASLLDSVLPGTGGPPLWSLFAAAGALITGTAMLSWASFPSRHPRSGRWSR